MSGLIIFYAAICIVAVFVGRTIGVAARDWTKTHAKPDPKPKNRPTRP